MPTYVYQCDKCDNRVEFILKVSERDSKEGMHCTECADGHLSKQVTTVAFGDAFKMGLGPKNPAGIKEALQRVHALTPGSRLDQTSTITKL